MLDQDLFRITNRPPAVTHATILYHLDLATHLAHAQQNRVQKSTAEIMDSNASS